MKKSSLKWIIPVVIAVILAVIGIRFASNRNNNAQVMATSTESSSSAEATVTVTATSSTEETTEQVTADDVDPILFQDTFDAPNDQWIVQDGEMVIENGVAKLDGNKGTATRWEHRYIWVDGIGTNVTVTAKFKIISIHPEMENRIGVITHCKGETTGDSMDDFKWITLVTEGKFKMLDEWRMWMGEMPYAFEEGASYVIKQMAVNENMYGKIWKDGEEEPEEWMMHSIQSGQYSEDGLGFYFPNNIVELDEFTVVQSPDLPPNFTFGKTIPGNVFEPGQSPEVEVIIDNSANKLFKSECAFNYEVTDFLGNAVDSGTLSITPQPEQIAKGKITLKNDMKLGQYNIRCEMSVDGKTTDVKTTSVAVTKTKTGALSPSSYFGIGSMGSFLDVRYDLATLTDSFALMERIGVKWTREEFFWDRLKPSKDIAYKWSRIDNNVILARENKIQILGLLDYWASWSLPYGDRANTDWDTALKNISLYATDVVTRYKPEGEFAKEQGWTDGYGVTSWEIWNEPETAMYWEGSPEEFGRMVKAVSEAIRRADPNAFIVASSWNSGFDETVLGITGENAYDGLAIHSYSRTEAPEKGNNYTKKIEAYNRWLAENGSLDTQVWVTETGWDSYNDISALQQANYIVRSYLIGIAAGLDKQFTFTFNFGSSAEGWGIMDENLSPKPAYSAYAGMTERLEGKKFLGEIGNMGRDIKAMVFSGGNSLTSVLWTLGGSGTADISYPATTKSKVFDMMGNVLGEYTGRVIVPVSESPVYIESQSLSASDADIAIKNTVFAGLDPVDIKISEITKYPVKGNMPVLDIYLTGRINETWKGKISLKLPEGWKTDKSVLDIGEIPPGARTEKLTFSVTDFQSNTSGSYPITVIVDRGDKTFEKTFDYPLYAIENGTVDTESELKDWPGKIQYAIDSGNYLIGDKEKWSTENVSAVTSFLWDERNLYLRVEVTDDVQVQTGQGMDMINGDSVQLYFDTGNDKDAAQTEDDILYCLGLSQDGTANFINMVTGVASNRVSGQIIRDEQNKKTLYEVSIRWTDMKMEPSAGKLLGMNIAVNDSDSEGTLMILPWRPASSESYLPELWVSMELLDRN